MTGKKIYGGIATNDADYVVQVKTSKGQQNGGNRKYTILWVCPFYERWFGILKRCFGSNRLTKYPSYKDCTICEEWLTFSNFKRWMETQDWEGNHLDKDILFEGNKLYSPETCVFVSRAINNFVNTNTAQNKERLLPLGVYWHVRVGKFAASCGAKFLGYFEDPDAASNAYRVYKYEMACKLAETCPDPRVANALITRFQV